MDKVAMANFLLLRGKGKGVQDESPPLHLAEKKRRGWSWNKLPWPSPFVPHRGVVEDESPPLHPIDKEKGLVMKQAPMANSPPPYGEGEGSEG